MTSPRPSRLSLAVAFALAAFASADAIAASGSFTFVTGQVTVTKANGQRVAAQRGTEVDPGDTITTGTDGMAQLTMIDQARLSLRPRTEFRIEGYQRTAQSDEGAVLSLVRGTLRAFTGLIASTNRDKFTMKTRVATVGIRGSGNILYACQKDECDDSVKGLAQGNGDEIAVNHTIEGSHAVTNLASGAAPGTPAQQGGAQTLITGPGQTVMIQGAQPPRYVPTPTFISDTATNPTGAAKAASADSANDGRNFAPGDNQQIATSQQNSSLPVGNNGLGFVTIDASNNLLTDPINLYDVMFATGGPLLGQAVQSTLEFDGPSGALRGYTTYAGTQTNLSPLVIGGTVRELRTEQIAPGLTVSLGRWDNASVTFRGPGVNVPVTGALHWAYTPSAYPTYLSDVLTGTASYTLAAATAPTNQAGITGSVATATMNVNFTNRTLGINIAAGIPANGGNAGGNWGLSASDVPFSLNTFYASTDDRLVVSNGATTSTSNSLLSGAIEGSFVGSALQGAIVGWGVADFTSGTPANHNTVNGIVVLAGPSQNGAAEWREGRVSDAGGYLIHSDFSRNFSTTNRPAEIVQGANGAVTSFVAPLSSQLGAHATYALGTAQVVESGFDAETGLVWGRWGGGVATVNGNGQSTTINLTNNNLHYIFTGTQQGPVSLPLTGTGVYDVIGSTTPTDTQGHTGTLGTATLAANFTNRTVAATVNVSINGQNWTGSAASMPIYRDQYFSASTGSNVPGVPNNSPLVIGCTPSCGTGATGSFDGFFAGATGQRAGMMYNMGGVQGAIAYGRRP